MKKKYMNVLRVIEYGVFQGRGKHMQFVLCLNNNYILNPKINGGMVIKDKM